MLIRLFSPSKSSFYPAQANRNPAQPNRDIIHSQDRWTHSFNRRFCLQSSGVFLYILLVLMGFPFGLRAASGASSMVQNQ